MVSSHSIEATIKPYKDKLDTAEYKLEILMRALEVHAGFMDYQCKRYNEVDKEKIAICKIMPPLKRLMHVFNEVREMDSFDKTRYGD